MAQFIGKVQGNKGEATRLGTKTSGITVECNGWNSGVKVIGRVDENGNDVFTIVITSGSNGKLSPLHAGFVSINDSGDVIYTSIIRGKKKL